MPSIVKYGKYILFGLIALFLIINVVRYIRLIERENNTSFNIIRDQRDSLNFLNIKLDSTIYALSNQSRKIDTLWKERKSHVDTAWIFSKKADSLVMLASADSSNSCALMTLAYIARTSECESLKLALSADSVSIKSSLIVITSVRDTLSKANRSISSIAKALDSVKSSYRCKILFIPCPSRTMSFLLGSGLTLLATKVK